uniref:RNS1 n=1 Tax=Arundo donax TaxID=35708 RepID=A0A0A9DX65_ARUDO
MHAYFPERIFGASSSNLTFSSACMCNVYTRSGPARSATRRRAAASRTP